MDGVMFSHSKRLDALRARIDAPDGIGRLRRITSHFTFSGDAAFQRGNIRVNSELEPAGCLGDLGWYNLRLILWVMGFRAPESVVAHTLTPLRGDSSPAAVPGEFSAELFFPGGVTASMYCSFLTENLQVSVIAGDRGYITLDDFVLPFFGAELDWHESLEHAASHAARRGDGVCRRRARRTGGANDRCYESAGTRWRP
jgi:predicted dehydrogenase